MDGIASFLNTRASFEVTALVVTWIGMTLLAVMVTSILIRVRRLELDRLETVATPARPYGQIRGRRVAEMLELRDPTEMPGLLIFLSANCRACSQMLDELAALRNGPSISLIWLDRVPEALPALPESVSTIPDGAAIARQLGIHVTPFVVELDKEGVIVDGRPVNHLSSVDVVSNGKSLSGIA